MGEEKSPRGDQTSANSEAEERFWIFLERFKNIANKLYDITKEMIEIYREVAERDLETESLIAAKYHLMMARHKLMDYIYEMGEDEFDNMEG